MDAMVEVCTLGPVRRYGKWKSGKKSKVQRDALREANVVLEEEEVKLVIVFHLR